MLSKKQAMVLAWPKTSYDALICDGAVRSGKTSIMTISYIIWAMERYDQQAFGICGKSVGAVERNIITPLMGVGWMRSRFQMSYNQGANCLTVQYQGRKNRFYVFGGKDESSASLIQGITFAGVLLDEVALMPRSFVEQALARTSVHGAKIFFNCNPASPGHWFYQEWILHPERHNATHLHFTMKDNPSLTPETIRRYETMFSGIFYRRFVLGEWCAGDGVIYDMYDPTKNSYRPEDRPIDLEWSGQRMIAVDYGTTNPTVFLDTYDYDGRLYVDREYRWDSRKEYKQKTDEEYAEDMAEFVGEEPCTIIVDPSAASFIAALKAKGLYVKSAENDVLDGIRKTANLMQRRLIKISTNCAGLIEELGSYSWDSAAAQKGIEKPVKEQDHACDALRYRVNALPEWRFEI